MVSAFERFDNINRVKREKHLQSLVKRRAQLKRSLQEVEQEIEYAKVKSA